MPRTYEFIVGRSESGMRLDRYLVSKLPGTLSRSMIQRGITSGNVTLRGRAAKPHDKLRSGESVVAKILELGAKSSGVDLCPEPIDIDVVYEDKVLLVVNKPPGLVVHPAPGHWRGTLVNGVLAHLQKGLSEKDSESLPRAGLVHRLDKDTSGLLIIAKSEKAHFALSKQLKDRTLSRKYLALVEGHIPLDSGTVDAPIGRHKVNRKEMSVKHLGGRSAVSHYRVIKRFNSNGPAIGGALCTLIEVTLQTGRTHQIRVHLAHIGYPVVGDTTYGRHPASFWQPLGITRQLLHAYSIKFVHPVSGKSLELQADPPPDLAKYQSL